MTRPSVHKRIEIEHGRHISIYYSRTLRTLIIDLVDADKQGGRQLYRGHVPEEPRPRKEPIKVRKERRTVKKN